ncbi:MAG: hypothetical protein QNJ85_20330 [Gammaproteobacteria bacterium]|nr:hypothetical protein [Gammaproteobacteria bacterium]
MKFEFSRLALTLSISTVLSLASVTAQAVSLDSMMVDGIINAGEYRWDTTTSPNSKWQTRNYSNTDGEINDGSGRDNWDINYLGTGISGSQFHIGAMGGSILGGSNTYYDEELELSDIAINVHAPGDSTDPAADSGGWDYALRLMSVDTTGGALFSLFSLLDPGGTGPDGQWIGSGKEANSSTYQHERYSYGSTRTFEMRDGYEVASNIAGVYVAPDAGDNGVLEVSLDLGLLSLFDEATGGRVITYLTMSCVNDEAIVDARVSPVPVPSAVWLFGSALIGFIGMSRRTRV